MRQGPGFMDAAIHHAGQDARPTMAKAEGESHMDYRPTYGVWEITLACDMGCRHCGSSCTTSSPDDLTTDEALTLCDDLADLGLQFITLSGGEPTLRPDWPTLARRLSELGIEANLITNGWLIDDYALDLAANAGLASIGISLDGLETTHDRTRRSGSFVRVVKALRKAVEREIPTTVATTVTRSNLEELKSMHTLLEQLGVSYWQLSLGLPMGNLAKAPGAVLSPAQIERLIDYAFSLLDTSQVRPLITDCVGYYTVRSVQLRQSLLHHAGEWRGCQAGRTSIGILHDGRIVGCTAIRDESFVEGSVREKPLRELWVRPGAFAWNRDRTRYQLQGFCRACRFGDVCRGGCSALMLSTTSALDENYYCAFRVATERLRPAIERINCVDKLLERAAKASQMELYEVARLCADRACCLTPQRADAWQMKGYAALQIGDLIEGRGCFEKALSIDRTDAYSWNGLARALLGLGEHDEAIPWLKNAVEAVPPATSIERSAGHCPP